MGTIIRTTDTAARIAEPNLPADDRSGDGYDYISTAEAAGWTVINVWGEEGYDFGAWPYVIGFARSAGRGEERRYGFGLYVEGDLKTDYYSSLEAVLEAISREAHWFWINGQSDGPADLPEKFEDLPATYRQPCKY